MLAVGDLAFQRKCLGKMESVATSGRTVLFVSHNLGAVRSLCGRVLLFEGGRLDFDGPTEEALERYEAGAATAGETLPRARFVGPLAGEVRFETFELHQTGRTVGVVDPGVPVEIEVVGESAEEYRAIDIAIGIFRDGHRLFSCHDGPTGRPLAAGRFRSRFRLESGTLRPGRYTIGFGATRPGTGEWTWSPEAGAIEVLERWVDGLDARDTGPISVPYRGERLPPGGSGA